MDVRLITADEVTAHDVDDLPKLLARPDGIVWVDLAAGEADAARVLGEVFGFHPLAVRDCLQRNRMPKVHVYADHVFLVLHAPEPGTGGHVHHLELDQFIGARWLVTVHGPLNAAVDSTAALRESRAVLARIDAGRLRPSSPAALSYAVVSALARAQESFVEETTRRIWDLERRVTDGHTGNPERVLEELFAARHGLLSVRTMAALCAEIYGRLAAVGPGFAADSAVGPGFAAGSVVDSAADAQRLVADLTDQFERVRSIADGEKEYLQGVIDFYRARTDTKMTIAAERLAVIAAVTLPVTAISSVLGMNIIVNARTDFVTLGAVLSVMGVISGLLLWWARRQGWW